MRFQFHQLGIRSARFWYISIISLIGCIVVVLVPPYQSPDEQTHLYRAYQLSEGTLLARKLSYGAGDVLPTSLSKSFDSYYYLLFQPEKKLDINKHRVSLNEKLNPQIRSETRFENTAPYPPFSYIPQVVGISFGKIFSANPVVLLYLARFANLISWVLILWLCMKRQPHTSLALFAFALLPIVIFQSASASADVMTAGASILFTLEAIRQATFKGAITKKDKILLLALGSFLALCKLPYILLTLLVFAIPNNKFGTKKKAWQFKLISVVIPIFIATLWMIISYKSFVNLRAIADTPVQLSFILHSPIKFATVLYNTYISPSSDGLYLQMIGQLGWLDTKIIFWNLLFSFCAVFLAVIGGLKAKQFTLPTVNMRWIATAITIVIIGAISSVLYLTWNAPKATIIDGLQGRYYIPLIGLLIFIFFGLLELKQSQKQMHNRIVYCLLLPAVIATLATIFFRYYSL